MPKVDGVSSPAISTTPKHSPFLNRESDRERERSEWGRLFASPIKFYGKVIDQTRAPVPDATIQVSLGDRYYGESNTKFNTRSDNNGRFTITGHGIGVTIDVRKDGYYRTADAGAQFDYVNGTGEKGPHTDSEKPAVFILRRAGEIVNLITKGFKCKLPIDGGLVEVDLRQGTRASPSTGDIRIQYWSHTSGVPNTRQRGFQWVCRLEVPSGGLIDRESEFQFEAPVEGYRSSDEITMAENSPQWRPTISKQYFVKVSGERYARIDFSIHVGVNTYFTVTSSYNPSGSRNLESGPDEHGNPR
jgi:hypothetical protein